MKYYIGIDLGGTNIVAGVVNESYEILSKASVKTNLPRPEKEIAADMAKVAEEAIEKAGLTKEQIEWVGVGTPGIANSATGVIEYSNNLGFCNTPMVSYLESALGKPTFIENDANAAAYGEYVAGAAKGAKNAVCITLGTGVGGGIIIDGKIYSGSNFGGAEIGHTVISVDGPLCTCGRKGCFEVFSSATGLVRMTKEALAAHPESAMKNEEKISARTAFNYMRAGDETAKQVVEDYIKYAAFAHEGNRQARGLYPQLRQKYRNCYRPAGQRCRHHRRSLPRQRTRLIRAATFVQYSSVLCKKQAFPCENACFFVAQFSLQTV